MTARTASIGGKGKPPALRIIEGRGRRKDGLDTDSGGRPILPGPDFRREPPKKPDSLSEDAEWLWDRVVQYMDEVGLLKPLDAPALEVACETFARWREAVRFRKDHALLSKNSQGTVTAPWIGIEERASREFRSWCAEFGFTPAAERNLIAGAGDDGGSDDDNPF